MCSDDIWTDELPKWSYREIFSLKAWLWILNSTVSISYYAHGSPCFPRNPENKSNLTWVRTLNGSQAQQVAFFLMSYPEGDFKSYPLGTPTWKFQVSNKKLHMRSSWHCPFKRTAWYSRPASRIPFSCPTLKGIKRQSGYLPGQGTGLCYFFLPTLFPSKVSFCVIFPI